MRHILTVITKIALFFLLLTFFSCDPSQSLRITNETDSDAQVMFVFKKGERSYKFAESLTADTLLVELEPKGQNAIREFHFGLGTWKIQSSLDSLISALEKIQLKSSTSTQTYTGAEQIRAFIKSRISGQQKEVIDIRL